MLFFFLPALRPPQRAQGGGVGGASDGAVQLFSSGAPVRHPPFALAPSNQACTPMSSRKRPRPPCRRRRSSFTCHLGWQTARTSLDSSSLGSCRLPPRHRPAAQGGASRVNMPPTRRGRPCGRRQSRSMFSYARTSARFVMAFDHQNAARAPRGHIAQTSIALLTSLFFGPPRRVRCSGLIIRGMASCPPTRPTWQLALLVPVRPCAGGGRTNR
jgi:hypothetical protein